MIRGKEGSSLRWGMEAVGRGRSVPPPSPHRPPGKHRRQRNPGHPVSRRCSLIPTHLPLISGSRSRAPADPAPTTTDDRRMKALETTVKMLSEQVEEQKKELKALRKLHGQSMKSQGSLEAEVGEIWGRLGGVGIKGGREYIGKPPSRKVAMPDPTLGAYWAPVTFAGVQAARLKIKTRCQERDDAKSRCRPAFVDAAQAALSRLLPPPSPVSDQAVVTETALPHSLPLPSNEAPPSPSLPMESDAPTLTDLNAPSPPEVPAPNPFAVPPPPWSPQPPNAESPPPVTVPTSGAIEPPTEAAVPNLAMLTAEPNTADMAGDGLVAPTPDGNTADMAVDDTHGDGGTLGGQNVK